MNCLEPIYLKYDKNFNGTKLDWIHYWKKRGYERKYIPPYKHYVPCGKCANCLKTLRNAWSFRLINHLDHSENAYFITLTYEDRFLPKTTTNLPTLDKIQLQAFFRNLKEDFPKIKYFAVGEYGGMFGRPHYHCIIFNMHNDMDRVIRTISKSWYFDMRTSVYKLNAPLVNYTTKYIIKPFDYLEKSQLPPFRLMSRGLGANFTIKQAYDFICNKQGYIQKGYVKYSPPRYIRDKMLKRLSPYTLSDDDLKYIHEQNYVGQIKTDEKNRSIMRRTTGYTPKSLEFKKQQNYFAFDYLKRNDTK